MMKKVLIIVVILLMIAGIIGYYSFGLPKNTQETNPDNNDNQNENIKTFVVGSSRLRFYMNGVENPDLVVKEGDRVRIEFTSEEGFHDWKIDEFNAATEKVNPGNSTSVEFIADKKGTFEYYCSVGQHRANGMKGKFIVE